MDILTQKERSRLMAKVRAHGNRSTEMRLVKLFRQHKITGWRRNQKVFGRPDFIFPKLKLAVFSDGCFWHGCPKHETKPKNNRAFWRQKFSRNKQRDALVTRSLQKIGWRVLRIWEHDSSEEKPSAARAADSADIEQLKARGERISPFAF